MVSKRHCKSNCPTSQDFNPDQPEQHIIYLDVNNLYGYAMSQSLPIDSFEWVDPQNINVSELLENHDRGYGYIFEIDLEYPSELHHLHNDYPLAPHRMVISEELLNSYQMNLKKDLHQKGLKPVKCEKLITSFLKRERCVVYHRTLKFYLEQGMKVTKVHRIIKFRENAWLKPYVDL